MTELVLHQARGPDGSAVVWKGSCVLVPALAGLHERVRIMLSTGEAYGSLGYIYCVGVHISHASSRCHRTNIYAPII